MNEESLDIRDIVFHGLTSSFPEYYNEIVKWCNANRDRPDAAWKIAERITVGDMLKAVLNNLSIDEVKRVL